MANAETVLSPALTTTSRSPARAMPDCEASDAPLPRPPVATTPAALSRPSGPPTAPNSANRPGSGHWPGSTRPDRAVRFAVHDCFHVRRYPRLAALAATRLVTWHADRPAPFASVHQGADSHPWVPGSEPGGGKSRSGCPEPDNCSDQGVRARAGVGRKGAQVKYMIMMFGGLGASIENRPPEWITGMHELLVAMDGELREAGELVCGGS